MVVVPPERFVTRKNMSVVTGLSKFPPKTKGVIFWVRGPVEIISATRPDPATGSSPIVLDESAVLEEESV